MARRREILKAVGLIAIGFVAGAVIVGGLVAWRYFKMFRQQYYTEILSNVGNAYLIRENLGEQLLRNMENNIQQNILSVDSLWGNDENRLNSFWYAKRYYERFKIPIPGNIKDILDKLPTDPLQEEFAASTLISVGDGAPVFTCTTIDGNTVSISDLRGKVILICFFATWCEPCIREMPYLQTDVFENIKNEDFFIIAIAREQQSNEVIEYKNKKGFTFPMASDPNGNIFRLFATQSIPRLFVIGRDGIVKWESGSLSRPKFEDLVSLIRKELGSSL